MRIGILGEGPTEVGPLVAPPGSNVHPAGGALRGIVERILQEKGVEAEWVDGPRPRGVGSIISRLPQHLSIIREQGAEVCVVLVDRDRKKERLQTLKRKYQAFPEKDLLPTAIGVAIETIEAWILADERAISIALGETCQIERGPNPETLNGKRGEDRHPKMVLRQLLKEHAPQDTFISHHEFIRAWTKSVRLGVLRDRCPKGFEPFEKSVRSLVGNE